MNLGIQPYIFGINFGIILSEFLLGLYIYIQHPDEVDNYEKNQNLYYGLICQGLNFFYVLVLLNLFNKWKNLNNEEIIKKFEKSVNFYWFITFLFGLFYIVFAGIYLTSPQENDKKYKLLEFLFYSFLIYYSIPTFYGSLYIIKYFGLVVFYLGSIIILTCWNKVRNNNSYNHSSTPPLNIIVDTGVSNNRGPPIAVEPPIVVNSSIAVNPSIVEPPIAVNPSIVEPPIAEPPIPDIQTVEPLIAVNPPIVEPPICDICMTNEINQYLVCSHSLCQACYFRIREMNNKCPFCRTSLG